MKEEIRSILLETAATHGTPLYVYDAERIRSQYTRLINAIPVDNLKINYACKANTNLNILSIFQKLDSGLDTVSIQEVRLGLEVGFKPADIIYTPNCVSSQEIEQAIKLGVKINLDNLEMLEHFGVKYGSKLPICLRINPHVMAGGNANISVGHIDSKFGISIHQMPHILRLVETLDLKIVGLHMHTGSDILDAGVFLRAAELLLDQVQHFDNLEYIDLGSGFKVKYYENDIATDIEDFGKRVAERFNKLCATIGKDLTLMFEPGKYLVSEAGYFLARVNVLKRTTSALFAGVDSGMNHFMRPMMYNAHHDIVNISNPEGTHRIYTVVGYICETDTFGWNRRIAEISQGDILCFMNAGAYCFSMASNYNSRYRPAEVLLDKGDVSLIRKRESYEDLISNQVWQR